MSADKLQALNNTLTDFLSEPASPATFFDEEPHDEAQAGERVAKTSDNLSRGSEIPREKFGKPSSREFGISPKEILEGPVIRDAGRPGMARRPAVADRRISPGGWALRGFAGLLLAIGVGAAAIVWSGLSSGDAAKTASSRGAPLAQEVPAAAASPEMTPLLQSMARDLASVAREIEQLRADRELMARDSAKLSEQLRANQDQLTRTVAGLSEQLKASQELVRENAKMAEQIQGIHEQLISAMSRISEQNPPRRIAATPRPAPLSAQPAATTARKPAPALSPAQTVAQPKVEKPKPPSTSRPPPPAR